MSLEVQIELGHKARKNIKSTIEGYTHDWTVFVQGVNGHEIKHIVEKVIFQLPDSYKEPKRIREKPPFSVSESTSRSISIMIDIFFCVEAKLTKLSYIYDMQIGDEAVNASRMSKLTFPNPNRELKEKLLLAGGQSVDPQRTLPMLPGGLVKCKVEPDDKIKKQNDVADYNVAVNPTVQKFHNLKNQSSMSDEELKRCKELLRENELLKSANAEIKRKIDVQEGVLALCEDITLYYETYLSKNNEEIARMKEEHEKKQREISSLKLELETLLIEYLKEKQASEYSEEQIRGTMRKNEDKNISADVGMENVTEPREVKDTSAPKLISFMTEHCQKLKAELNRIKNSEFSKCREGTNSLFYKLRNIDINPITEECYKQYLSSLLDYFTNAKTFDMASLIYVIIDYLYHDRVQHESLPTYILDESTCVVLPQSENCIISALYTIDSMTLPYLNMLVKNTLDLIHQVAISKKNMAVNGLASLCRVFMEMCRRSNDRWKPLFLCCELLKLGHPLAPYLINVLASVWRDPFKLYDEFSVEGNMALSAIMYGLKEKPLLMDNSLWERTQQLISTYFPHLSIIDYKRATEFLTAKIVSRCVEGLFENLWMLASPLVIFVSKETWDWKMQFRQDYILHNLRYFSQCLSGHAFGLFCNLYVDIFKFSDESLYEELLQYFANTSLHEGVQDSAAIALLIYLGVKDKHIPVPLRNWFLRNQDNPKLAPIVDLYHKQVMESHGSFLLWDDIIMV